MTYYVPGKDDYKKKLHEKAKENGWRSYRIDKNPFSWDYSEWFMEFDAAHKRKNGFKELRAEVFKSTVAIVQNGSYYINKTEKVDLNPDPDLAEKTVFYRKPHCVESEVRPAASDITVINADCLETAKLMSLSGLNPAVLNMASRKIPGGGVLNGAGAQEENIFRRSSLFASLYQFCDSADQYGIKRNPENSYPLDRNTGGIYSPGVTVFRGTEAEGYALLKKPYKLSFISAAAINMPDLITSNGELRIAEHHEGPTKEKIRTILRIALIHKHDSLVLSAFGCGAFRNPPKHMAELFHSVFMENEFISRFKVIAFAIVSDHNSGREHNPEGNLIPFMKVFG